MEDGSIVPVSQSHKQLVKSRGCSRRKERRGGAVGVDRTDPLGLLQLQAEMKRRGWVAVRVLGSFGVLGGLAWWVVRTLHGEGGDVKVWGVGVREWWDLGGAL